MYDVIALTPRRQEYRIGRFTNYEAAAKRISRLSLILPGWRFRIERRVSHSVSHAAH
jgi:hypothetical protein